MFDAITNIPKENLAAHFHDTYDKAIENLLVALEVIYFSFTEKKYLISFIEWYFNYR